MFAIFIAFLILVSVLHFRRWRELKTTKSLWAGWTAIVAAIIVAWEIVADNLPLSLSIRELNGAVFNVLWPLVILSFLIVTVASVIALRQVRN